MNVKVKIMKKISVTVIAVVMLISCMLGSTVAYASNTTLSIDANVYVDVGSEGSWNSVLSTAEVRLESMKKQINLALAFLETGKCSAKNTFETARQFNLIRDAFSQIAPSSAVYDKNNRSAIAPWSSNLSGIITSCGNLYTTSDGKDLLYEVVCVLTYAHYMEVDVISQGWGNN